MNNNVTTCIIDGQSIDSTCYKIENLMSSKWATNLKFKCKNDTWRKT